MLKNINEWGNDFKTQLKVSGKECENPEKLLNYFQPAVYVQLSPRSNPKLTFFVIGFKECVKPERFEMDEYKVIVMLVVMLCWVINCRLKVGRCENGDCSGDGKCICKNGFSGTTCDTKEPHHVSMSDKSVVCPDAKEPHHVSMSDKSVFCPDAKEPHHVSMSAKSAVCPDAIESHHVSVSAKSDFCRNEN